MKDFLVSVVPELIGGLLAIICAIIGAKIATSSSEQRERKKELMGVYSEVFANYYACALNPSDEHKLRLVVSIERAGLVCSKKSEAIMEKILLLISEESMDIKALSEQIKELRISSKEDVRNAHRKKHSAEDE